MTLHTTVTLYVYAEPKMCTIELIISYLASPKPSENLITGPRLIHDTVTSPLPSKPSTEMPKVIQYDPPTRITNSHKLTPSREIDRGHAPQRGSRCWPVGKCCQGREMNQAQLILLRPAGYSHHLTRVIDTDASDGRSQICDGLEGLKASASCRN